MPLDLDLSSEQDMLTEMVAGVADRFSPLTRVRDLEDDPTGYSPELWAQLGELGLIGLLLPEAHGGSGMSMVDAVVVYKELGRNLVPSPHLVSSVLAGGLIARGAGEDQHAQRGIVRQVGEHGVQLVDQRVGQRVQHRRPVQAQHGDAAVLPLEHEGVAHPAFATTSRSLNFWILPLGVRGRSATTSTRSGQYCLATLHSAM